MYTEDTNILLIKIRPPLRTNSSCMGRKQHKTSPSLACIRNTLFILSLYAHPNNDTTAPCIMHTSRRKSLTSRIDIFLLDASDFKIREALKSQLKIRVSKLAH